jgi:hypothetical protein
MSITRRAAVTPRDGVISNKWLLYPPALRSCGPVSEKLVMGPSRKKNPTQKVSKSNAARPAHTPAPRRATEEAARTHRT